MTGPLKISFEREDTLLVLTLARPKANIIDAEMIAALDAAFALHVAPAVKAVLLSAEGPHFSFGASVAEHLPQSCAVMLKSLHGLIYRMLDCPVPILVAVQGQCLGGGLEVALAGDLRFAASDAKFGQPEIMLGVIAPAASALLPELIGHSAAADILFSGRALDVREAAAAGLIFRTADDPRAAALDYFDQYLAAKSAAALRLAATAARGALARRVRVRLQEVEKLYLEKVMATRDAVEGLNAFLEKRPAKWEHC
jgi:cyclohexa-1,5-dienecarbonyl-CoA hydratase